jgi:hypothetical protein
LGRDIEFVAEIASRYQSPSFPENEDSQVNALASGLQASVRKFTIEDARYNAPNFPVNEDEQTNALEPMQLSRYSGPAFPTNEDAQTNALEPMQFSRYKTPDFPTLN